MKFRLIHIILPVVHLEEFSIKKVSVRVFLKENYREQHFLFRKFVFSILPAMLRDTRIDKFSLKYTMGIILLFLMVTQSLFAGNEGIRFIENKGQWSEPFLYKADLGNGALFVEQKAFTYNLYNADEIQSNHFSISKTPKSLKHHAFRVNFLNTLNAKISHSNKYPEYYNFLLGNDKNLWKNKIAAYQQIEYKNLYQNIDLVLYSMGNFLKYDVIVNPTGQIADVQLFYEGTDLLRIDRSGNLIVKTSVGDVVEQKPYAYQNINNTKIEIGCEYILKNNVLSFKIIGKYNKNLPLIIDPVLIFSSFSGSNANNFGMTATYGYDGSLFAGGTGFGVGYPTTLGAFDPSFNGVPGGGITDVVITRYDSTGTNLIYSTYIGGVQTETVHSLIANENNELYLYGATSSLDFPMLGTSYNNTFAGGTPVYYVSTGANFINGTDIFISKLSADGTTLMGSTYLGGSQNDGINTTVSNNYDSLMNNYGDVFRGEIMLDAQGNCYLASSSRSANFPIVNGFDNSLNGLQDGIIAKLNNDLSVLEWSSYIGGSNVDAGYSIKIDDSNYVYVCGGTASLDFVTTSGTINTSYQGGMADGFVIKIDTNGSQILASTLLGTNAYDQCYFLETDRFGSIYVVGQTRGTFPIINAPYSNPNSSNFVMRLSNDLTTIDYSTIFGNGNINAKFSPSAFLVDRCENVYVSGWGGDILTGINLTGMPTTPDAVFPNSPNGFDFYLIVLERNVQSLLYGTYFGGTLSREHVDGGTSRFDKNGIVYQSVCAGCQNNDDFPTTPGAWSATNNSTGCNNGIFKFDFQIVPKAQFTVDNYEGCSPLTVTFTNNSNSSDTYLWDFGGGDTTSLVLNPVRTFTTPGTFYVTLIIQDSICNTIDTAQQVIVVNPPIVINALSNNTTSCDPVVLTASASGATSYIWSSNVQFTDTLNPNLSDSITVFNTQTTTYYVLATNGICNDIDSVTITFHVPSQPNIGLNTQQGCAPLTVNFTNNSGPHDYYLWNFGSGDTTSQTLNPIRTFSTPGSYPVTLTVVDSICNTSFTANTTITVAPVVTISVPNNSINTCDSVMLYSTATGATSYIWSTNNQFTDTLNPSLTDSITVFNTQTTTYYVMATNGICSDIDSVTITFHSPSQPNIGLNTQQGCTPLTVNFTNNSGPHDYYLWDFGSGDTTSQILNPIRTFATAGTYPVTLTVVDSICNTTFTTSTTITVANAVTIVTPSTINTCDSALLYSTTTGATSYIWSTNNQFTDTINPSLNDSVFVTVSDTTTYYLMATNGVCPAIDSIKVNFIGVQIVATGGATCNGANDTLSVISLNNQTLTYNWQPVSDIISGENTAFPIVNPSSTTTYNVTAQNVFGCSATASATVIVSGFNPNNIFITADDDTLLNGETTFLHAQPDSNFTYLWLPSASLNNNTIAHPLANPTSTTTYTVFFTETTSGCIYRKVYTLYAWEIICGEPDVFLPNAFTPNGDKENDVLYLRGRNVESMYLKIYNRWGELVFETDKQNVGWDGTYKGKPVDPAVFVYHLSVICVDKQEYFKKGNVTVIR
jgi:gliding motility-associated-like protein